MQLRVEPGGRILLLYDELLDLTVLGERALHRAGFVEPDARGQWWVDLAPQEGPRLGPFARRSEALAAEVAWLEHQVLLGPEPRGGSLDSLPQP